MKTDLSKILAISGQSGLYLYISQARNGAIVEALSDKKRSSVSLSSKITSLADISIYTDDEEVKPPTTRQTTGRFCPYGAHCSCATKGKSRFCSLGDPQWCFV